jgi:hypothetical protein
LTNGGDIWLRKVMCKKSHRASAHLGAAEPTRSRSEMLRECTNAKQIVGVGVGGDLIDSVAVHSASDVASDAVQATDVVATTVATTQQVIRTAGIATTQQTQEVRWWPGAGSNRRPTAFQAVARTS